ncbi:MULTISPECIES: D-2-hydroxyacid dehydrogenase [unclassified Campylobacter]|uniref:D-2-hydroxyacid dehydrogenase n=1 Tax=unclassified Campylobacter TaxID=2593542 RepID=UPI001237FF26|nr:MULTISPECIES: D-2-hydroxyacid dehydrogenase [unclassified Campylobacter]KAA6228529.1 D-2-hydroxyacid dehydrogenase [Campylobacter sp. LR286c]KAA6230920.1 D-2-hydroxyacid dehydrogenase [Campylobacter sp. LR291e]
MKIVCLDAATLGNYDLSVFQNFGEFISYQTTPKDKVIERLQGADVAMVNKIIMDKEVLSNTNLKLILETATGVNNIDLEYAKEKNIIVKNAAGYSTKSVVQHTFALIFAFLNQIVYYDKWVKDGNWTRSEIFTDYSAILTSIQAKNYGIIGLGTIGKEVAKIASAFGANLCYYSTSGKNNDSNYNQVNLEELLETCDVISIHAPLNENTKNLLKEKELMLLKENAILINMGRGGIINEEDLAKVIDKKNIRVGLDVLEKEPMIANHPLLSIKNKQNLIITPHVAWASTEAVEALMKIVYTNLLEWVANGK